MNYKRNQSFQNFCCNVVLVQSAVDCPYSVRVWVESIAVNDLELLIIAYYKDEIQQFSVDKCQLLMVCLKIRLNFRFNYSPIIIENEILDINILLGSPAPSEWLSFGTGRSKLPVSRMKTYEQFGCIRPVYEILVQRL